MADFVPPPPPSSRLTPTQAPAAWGYALWKFSRPHTIVGTSLSVLGIGAMALALGPGHGIATGVGWATVGLVVTLTAVACLLGNLYIVGLNQMTDVAIDRINKPHLPVASGEFSPADGWRIVTAAGVGSVVVGAIGGVWLLGVVLSSFALGSAYSLPPLRLKRFPFWASFCILAVRGAVVNLGLYLHYHQRFYGLAGWPLPAAVWVLGSFVVLFSIGIALFKDIPDIEGDRRYNISTFTVRLGQRRVFHIGRWILTLAYAGVVVLAPRLAGVNGWVLAGFHLAALGLFWLLSLRVARPGRGGTITYPAFYQFIWKLFFLEYVMFPLACWLA